VACSEQGQGGSNSSISSYIPFLFLIGSVIGLLQVKDLFETHPSNMWISVAALTIFCFSHAATKKMIINWAQLIDTLRVHSAALVVASLLSVLLPYRLCYLPFLMWLLLASILAYPGLIIKAFHSVINISKRVGQRTTVEPDGLPV
jgi:hypothetical protein